MRPSSMYMWLMLVAACGGNHDASPDAGRCPTPMATIATCSTTCGNGTIDDCAAYEDGAETCPSYRNTTEECDGSAFHVTCGDRGYYGGTATCFPDCTFYAVGCDACASSGAAADCRSFDYQELYAIAGSDPSQPEAVAIVRNVRNLTVYQYGASGTTLTAQQTLNGSIRAMVGAPSGGWWAVDASSGVGVMRIAADLTVAPTQPLAQTAVTTAQIATGPNGRALIAWSTGTAGNYQIWVAVVDGSDIVTPAYMLASAATMDYPSVVSDGVSFFVAGFGSLYRLAADGSQVAKTDGLPSQTVALAWGNGHGWASVSASDVTIAQRFDASGALVDDRFTLSTPQMYTVGAWQIDGDTVIGVARQQLATTITASKLQLVRIDASNAMTMQELGASDRDGVALVRFGTHIAAEWTGADRMQIAVLAP